MIPNLDIYYQNAAVIHDSKSDTFSHYRGKLTTVSATPTDTKCESSFLVIVGAT